MKAPKYSKDAPFEDPVVRCDACGKLVKTEFLHKHGFCSNCGNRRVRQVVMLREDEIITCRNWNIDREFMDLFEVVDEG